MKIYMVYESDYDHFELVGLYLNQYNARKAAADHVKMICRQSLHDWYAFWVLTGDLDTEYGWEPHDVVRSYVCRSPDLWVPNDLKGYGCHVIVEEYETKD
jgi:hypothetical protein